MSSSRVVSKSWFGSIAVPCCCALLVTSCSGDGAKESKASEPVQVGTPPAQHDPPAPEKSGGAPAASDGLRNALSSWPSRWQKFDDLGRQGMPDEAAALCKRAASALRAVKAALSDGQADQVVMRKLAELAISAETARAAVEGASKARGDGPRSGASVANGRLVPVASARAAVIPAQAPGTLPTQQSGGRSGLPAELMGGGDVAEPFRTAARLALRHLGVYLKHGSLDVRRAAVEELEGVAKTMPAWAELFRTLAESRPFERDPVLAAKLGSMAQRGADTSSRTSPVSGASQGVPAAAQ